MLYQKYVKMHMKSSMQFKVNTSLLAFSTILVSVSELLAIYMLFRNFETVGHWGFYETALMFGVITTVYSFVECFARGFDEFDKIVRNGELDRMLVRPVNIIYQLFGSKIELSKLPKTLLAIGVCVYSIIKLGIQWTFTKVAVLLLMFVCGSCVIFGVILIGAGICIFTVEKMEFVNIFTDGAKELAYYPINIYSKWLTQIFTFVLPVACFNYLPLNYIMGYGSLPSIIYALSPIFGILFIVPCLLFFLWSLKKYQGTGT